MGAKDEKTEDIELHRNGKFARDFSFIKLRKRQSSSQDKITELFVVLAYLSLRFSGLVLIHGINLWKQTENFKIHSCILFHSTFFPEQSTLNVNKQPPFFRSFHWTFQCVDACGLKVTIYMTKVKVLCETTRIISSEHFSYDTVAASRFPIQG